MQIQYFSDIHLEFGECKLSNNDADILVAAGDISTGAYATEWLAGASIPIVYIAGNHEYYGGDLVHTQKELIAASKMHNIHFLENDIFIYEEVRFLGATLWTDFNGADKELMDQAIINMNDYACIQNDNSILSPGDILKINTGTRKWLATQLETSFKGKTVVVTHHAPSIKSWNAEYEPQLKYSYCNQMDAFIKKYNIDLWIHGHIHHASDYYIGKTRVVCNPRGYYGFQPTDNFDMNKQVII